MAWYRCGGGGVPASVKTDMNAVLNKKFGTSTDYPPADWAPTVNLMGPLPEKTQASASVCSFDDGADDVPTKSLIVTIPPTLDGVSSFVETQTGRNLLDVPAREELTRNGVISSVASDGTITASGQSTGNGDIPITLGTSANLIGGQTYTFSINGTDTRTGSIYVYFAGGSYISINNANHSGTYTPSADQTITGVTLRMFNGQSITLSAKIMLEYGSTAHAYEPYQTPTQYTASLGRTIYGGQVDIVNGVGTDENGNDFTFTGQEIPTRLGVNNFWSDEGDTEVTYRADIDLLLGGN